MRYAITGVIVGAVVALLLSLHAVGHALPAPYHKPWSQWTLKQRESYVRSNLYHARWAIRWARSHASLYPDRGRAVVASHKALSVKATRNLRAITTAIEAKQHWPWYHQGGCVETLIRRVWGGAADSAIAVARCESGLIAWPRVDGLNVTGQYVGIFQLGTSERASWGYGLYASSDADTALSASAWDQIVAGHRLYLDLGWGPWECARIVGIL